MTKLKLCSCDRCGNRFEVDDTNEPFTLEVVKQGPLDSVEETVYHLCDDCEETFWMFHARNEEFDQLAEKLRQKECKNIE